MTDVSLGAPTGTRARTPTRPTTRLLEPRAHESRDSRHSHVTERSAPQSTTRVTTEIGRPDDFALIKKCSEISHTTVVSSQYSEVGSPRLRFSYIHPCLCHIAPSAKNPATCEHACERRASDKRDIDLSHHEKHQSALLMYSLTSTASGFGE
jgi:hypothetical protein